jgi:hypothetical protein
MKILGTFAILLAALPVAALAQSDRTFGWGIDQHCYDGANQAAALWAKQGIADATIQKQFQQYLAACSGADQATAAFVGAVNVDYYRLAKLILSGKIQPDLYVGLVRDRERKMRHAVKNTVWLNAYLQGDSDGDLIPDAMDRCPGTPDLTRTDDQGCPDATPLAPQPPMEKLQPLFGKMHLMTALACDKAPLPDISTPIKLGFANGVPGSKVEFAFAVTKVSGQPANCVNLYEVQVQMQGVIDPQKAPPSRFERVVFRSTENTDLGPTGQQRQVFRVSATDTGIKYKLFAEAGNYTDFEFRVRAVNGNGQSSGWSEWVKSAGGFGEP